MPTPQLRLFWNTKYPQFTFSSFVNPTNINPLGSAITHNLIPAEAVVDPANFGATYNIQDISPAQADANFAAIQKALASLPDSGGTLFISGYLQYEGTIQNPLRGFVPQNNAKLPIPFTIRGCPQSALIQLAPGAPAVDLEGGYSFQNGSTSAPVILKNMQIYSKGKGVITKNGGKETQLLNLRIAGCYDTGLDIQYFDGGRIRDVYCINNGYRDSNGNIVPVDGAHIDLAHMDDIVITCRGNSGVGLKVTNSAAHDLWVYSEANLGKALVFDQFKYNRITLWEEACNGSSYGVQGIVTNSPHNSFFGSAQQEANRAFDIDDISACTSTFNGKPLRSLNSKKIDVQWPPVEGNIHGPFNQTAPAPVSKVVGSAVQIQVPVSYYTQQNPNLTQNWIELYGAGWYPPLIPTFDLGDSLMVKIRLKADATMAAYFRNLMKSPSTVAETVKIILQGQTGVLGGDGQTVNLRTEDEFEVEVTAPIAKAGSDTVRLFLYVCPAILGAAGNLQPPTPQTLTVTYMEFFHLKGIPA